MLVTMVEMMFASRDAPLILAGHQPPASAVPSRNYSAGLA
jgi:hypothetical protein